MAVQKHICAGCLWLRHSCKKHYLCFYNRSIIWGYSYSTKHLRWLQDGIADFKQVSYSRQVLVTKFKCLHLLWQPLLHLWVWMRLRVRVRVCECACVHVGGHVCPHQWWSVFTRLCHHTLSWLCELLKKPHIFPVSTFLHTHTVYVHAHTPALFRFCLLHRWLADFLTTSPSPQKRSGTFFFRPF